MPQEGRPGDKVVKDIGVLHASVQSGSRVYHWNRCHDEASPHHATYQGVHRCDLDEKREPVASDQR